MGWDYLVEFPLPHWRDTAPFDSSSISGDTTMKLFCQSRTQTINSVLRTPKLLTNGWRKIRYHIDSNIGVQVLRGDKETLRGGLTYEFDQAKRLSDFVDLVVRLAVCLFGAAYFYHLSKNATNPLDKFALFYSSLITFGIFILLLYRALRIITIYFLIGPTGPATRRLEKVLRVVLLALAITLTLVASRGLVVESLRLVHDNPLLKLKPSLSQDRGK